MERAREEGEKRREMGFVGEWSIVESTTPSITPREEEEGDVKLEEGELGQKRPFPVDDDEDAGHRWKLRKKTTSIGLGELYDPGVIKLKTRAKSATVDTVEGNGADGAGWVPGAGEENLNGPRATDAPRWTTLKWRKPGEAHEESASAHEEATSAQEEAPSSAEPPVIEEAAVAVKQEEVDVKPELIPVQEPPAGLFKKRKRPVRS